MGAVYPRDRPEIGEDSYCSPRRPMLSYLRVFDHAARSAVGYPNEPRDRRFLPVGTDAQARCAIPMDVGTVTQARCMVPMGVGVMTQARCAIPMSVGAMTQAYCMVPMGVG